MKSIGLSPASAARAERRRLAQEEGVQAMADVERRAVEVRQNMERLRALRKAREVADGGVQAPLPRAPSKRRSKRVVR